MQYSKNNTEPEIMRPLVIWGEFMLEQKRVAKTSRMQDVSMENKRVNESSLTQEIP